jgi:serine/threonine protein kinase
MTDDPLVGHQLANFRLERVLGRGGMGQVYYGWDVKLHRPVAVKVIDLRFRNNPIYAQRFVREAQAVATWRHENIAQVYYADEQDGLYYFAMEYVDGMDLAQLLSDYVAKDELMPQADVLRIARALANALDYAHARDVVHRDVKPSNVIVARDGRVVLTDFGLALDIQEGSMGEVFGTAHYMAPEQARRSSGAVPQSDLYSLGIILYEMLTGMVPFDDPSPTAVAVQHITQPPPAPRSLNPDLNTETEAVLLKALSKSPHDRYQSGDELTMALENALHNSQRPDGPLPLPPVPAGLQVQFQPSLAEGTRDEKNASHAPVPPTTPPHVNPLAPEIAHAQRQFTQPRNISVIWLTIGGGILFLVVIISLASLLFANLSGSLFQTSSPPANTEAVSGNLFPASATDAQPTEPSLPLADTSIPPEVIIATGTSDAVTSLPEASTSSSPASLPTVKYPNGKRFMLFYDDNSLYFLNLSDSNVPINWVAFERLSDEDTPLNRFNGSRWGQFYPTSTPNRCMAIEILGSETYLHPPECAPDNFYLSLRTPARDDATVFWTTQEGSHQFRVLWREGGQDEEIARCEIGAGSCEVYLP